jgi:hypothetical protein
MTLLICAAKNVSDIRTSVLYVEIIITPSLKLWVILLVMFITSLLQCVVEIFRIFFIQVIGSQVCTASKPPLEKVAKGMFF